MQGNHLKQEILKCKESIESQELSNMILKSLFINQEDEQVEERANHQRKNNLSDKRSEQWARPNWKVVSNAAVDLKQLPMENQSLELDLLTTSSVDSEGNETDFNEMKSYGLYVLTLDTKSIQHLLIFIVSLCRGLG